MARGKGELCWTRMTLRCEKHRKTSRTTGKKSKIKKEKTRKKRRHILIRLIELRPHVLRGGGLGLLLQDSRLLLYFLFLFHEGKVYKNSGKQRNRSGQWRWLIGGNCLISLISLFFRYFFFPRWNGPRGLMAVGQQSPKMSGTLPKKTNVGARVVGRRLSKDLVHGSPTVFGRFIRFHFTCLIS